MTTAALASLTQLINQILPNLQSYFLLCSRKKMASLHDNLVFLQDFLQRNSGQTISDWDVRIRDVVYQAKDIIQSHISKKDAARDEEQFDALQRCINEVDAIVAEATKMKEIPEKEDHLPDSSTVETSTRASVGKESMVGVDEDLTLIKDRVMGDEQNLRIIPITGMGGIGKTTLAKSVYEDHMIVDYFDTRHWVTVSQEYNVQHILGKILSVEGSNAEFFIELVYKSLKGRRYLIVMDDMWHAEVWDKVRRAFPDDCNGSRVIITTRLSEVALNIDSDSHLHRMRLLDEDQSWALFCRKAFADERPPGHMEEIGKSIARNCKGLPLAVIVMAGLLKANKTREYWENIAENVNVASTVNDDDRYSGIFSLSYSNLSHQLKSCFLYMGVFPEDYEIPVKKLIKLWVADGFLEPVEPKSLEELAEEYLEDLVERSLVLIMNKRSNGRIRFCKIHDVLRDLSIRKGREERFLQHFIEEDRSTFSKLVEGQHRLGIYTYDWHFLKTNIRNSSIHSLLYFASETNQLSSFASQFKSLRVVDELLVDSKFFPDKIFKLVNLRYLAFTYNHSGECVISPSISKLQNLQTLIIKRGSLPTDYMCRVILPLEIWKMPQLRHLVLMRNTFLCFPYRDGIGGTYPVLENLQTLSNVMNFKFTKEVVEGFPNLKKLRFQYNGIEPKQWAKFGLDNLVYLQELEEFNFRFHAGSARVDSKPLATNLTFPQRLRKLTLTRSGIPWEKMSMVGSLPNLEVLKLMKDSFVGEEWEPVEGEFLVLRYLEIESTNLSEWRVESDHFPCLERLIIRWCYKLKEVPSSVGDIPTLQRLTMQSCNVEAEDSLRRIQEEQQSQGNDALQVRILYPSKRAETTSEQPRQNQNSGGARVAPQRHSGDGTTQRVAHRRGRTGTA
ncbi:putative late blight resistance protein homolog R1A-3 [Primulina huaijiensis]|uniref:putative late blight resistance protein homolog R1A-3 n=1 Tax=Primulina huaijiensis TaxID=1492673 RepID=UPI003CC6FE94